MITYRSEGGVRANTVQQNQFRNYTLY